ncbi:hypothetical protein F3Y22_tig00117021pilonHSYRG00324 [Hibiscus syriacus]|uniref:Uncharacterized protein n=1 Tax=Hibiscus syriacus TaxID=106335 RepID=A0A6A2WID3_HIBSY|nr:hypothetical protein F3Y22_tig00117021pilonHSYRG00324 [Hibiscus syriacus]
MLEEEYLEAPRLCAQGLTRLDSGCMVLGNLHILDLTDGVKRIVPVQLSASVKEFFRRCLQNRIGLSASVSGVTMNAYMSYATRIWPPSSLALPFNVLDLHQVRRIIEHEHRKARTPTQMCEGQEQTEKEVEAGGSHELVDEKLFFSFQAISH